MEVQFPGVKCELVTFPFRSETEEREWLLEEVSISGCLV